MEVCMRDRSRLEHFVQGTFACIWKAWKFMEHKGLSFILCEKVMLLSLVDYVQKKQPYLQHLNPQQHAQQTFLERAGDRTTPQGKTCQSVTLYQLLAVAEVALSLECLPGVSV